jgi:hypothetical protein
MGNGILELQTPSFGKTILRCILHGLSKCLFENRSPVAYSENQYNDIPFVGFSPFPTSYFLFPHFYLLNILAVPKSLSQALLLRKTQINLFSKYIPIDSWFNIENCIAPLSIVSL